MANHLFKYGKLLKRIFLDVIQLTTYINMTNHLYEYGKPFRHILIY